MAQQPIADRGKRAAFQIVTPTRAQTFASRRAPALFDKGIGLLLASGFSALVWAGALWATAAAISSLI